MTDKKEKIIIDGKECRYWFRPNPSDYRRCALRGKDDNCDEIEDCFIKELLGKLAQKEQDYEKLKKRLESFQKDYSKLYQVVENKDYIKELDQYKQALDIIEEYCKQCNLRWDFTAQIVLDIINKTKEK